MLIGAAPLCLVGYFGLKALIHRPLQPTLAYPNKFQKREYVRSNFKSAELCGACHKSIYDEWKKSYMSRSYRAGIGMIELHAISLGLRGMESAERRWCIQCHAPLALTTAEDLEASDPIVREGVTCTVCHSVSEAHPDVHPGNVTMDPLGGMNGPFDDAASPMHPSRHSKLFSSSDSSLCGTCHWSAYPGNHLPIDATYPEWLEYREMAVKIGESPKSCQECHMPISEGKAAQLDNVPKRRIASHAFPGGRDETLIRNSAELAYELGRETSGGAVLKVRVKNLAGHNLPTGNASWPQVGLTVRFLQGAESREMAAFKYHASYLLEDGSETYDTTIAHAAGPSTALKPFETRIESIGIPEETFRLLEANPQRCAIEIELSYRYIRILDATAPFLREGDRAYTVMAHVYQWLTLDETNLAHVVDTLTDADTYRRLGKMGEVNSMLPILMKKEIVRMHVDG